MHACLVEWKDDAGLVCCFDLSRERVVIFEFLLLIDWVNIAKDKMCKHAKDIDCSGQAKYLALTSFIGLKDSRQCTWGVDSRIFFRTFKFSWIWDIYNIKCLKCFVDCNAYEKTDSPHINAFFPTVKTI